VLVAVSGCAHPVDTPPSSTASPPASDAAAYATATAKAVTVDAMMGHLAKLQEIADANGGNRAIGTPGYEKSVDYVADALRAKGFDVQTAEFDLPFPFADDPVVTVGGSTVSAKPIEYTAGTSADGVSGRLVPVGDLGCTDADYQGVNVAGAVVLVDRGRCPFGEKQTIAAGHGAVAVIVANNVDDDASGATLGRQTEVKIPAVTVSRADGGRLRSRPGQATIRMNAGVRNVKTRNVIAQTKTGSTQNVVVVGGHLDSVPAGPGINDDGSGVAAVLETALQMGSSPPVRHAVRFGFWAAEEVGLLGSAHYVQSLDVDQLKDIALYLNFDMLGSPNPAYFTMDGDQSSPPEKQRTPPRIPEGSAGIERTLIAYLDGAGKTAQDAPFAGSSDYDSFTRAGIPAGGIFSGANTDMTADEAKLWGGDAGRPYDPNYHRDTDTLDHIDRTALGINGSGAAYAVALYSQELGGRNGMPERADRTRHPIPKP
jgi:Zn-dependent M28 family amino/carboxypeptidase